MNVTIKFAAKSLKAHFRIGKHVGVKLMCINNAEFYNSE